MNYSIKQVQAIRKCSESISYSNANILAKDGYVKEFSSGLKDFVKTLLMSKESKETMFTCIDRYLASFDKKKMVLDEPIKALGTHNIKLKLHPKVTGTLKVKVVEK